MSNPNPMNARCGSEDCDCEYTIGGLLRRLELIAQQALLTVSHTRSDGADCDDTCICYVAGSEAERRPLGA